MDHKKIIKSRHGILIGDTENPFEKLVIKCHKNHLFYKYINDIKLGEWCDVCDYKIENILTKLGIEYVNNFYLDNIKYEIKIKNIDFVIITKIDYQQDKIDNALKNDFFIIVVDHYPDNIDSLIWNAIKERDKLTIIEKKTYSMKNDLCNKIEHLKNEKEDSGSLIKHAENIEKDKPIALGYIRVSTTMQVQDGFSLEAQEQKLYNEVSKRDLTMRSIFIDRGISGGSINKRLALEKLLETLKENYWVIVNSVSRLARNTKDLLHLVELIEQKKCHLVIIDLNLDITSPSGKLILTLLASQAQFEREITSERVKSVMGHLKSIGALRTKPHFGWMMNPDKSKNAPMHIKNPEEQKLIEEIRKYRSYCKHMGPTAFADFLNSKGLSPPRNSKKWYHKTLKIIMEREGIR